MKRSDKFKGYVYAVLSSSTFGLAPFFTLMLLDGGLSSFGALFYRWGFAAAALGCFGLMVRQNFRLSGRDAGTICLLGLARAMTSLCLIVAYQYIATGVASAIHFLYPLAVACGMSIFFRERISWKTGAAILVSLIGAVMLSSNDLGTGGRNAAVGISAAGLSVICYSAYMIGVRKTRAARIDSAALTFYVTLFGAILFGCCAMIFDGGIELVTGWKMWLCVLGVSLPATAISNITLVNAIKYIGPTLTSLFGAMEPLTALIVGILAFGERFTAATAIGMALVIAAVSSVVLGNGKGRTP